MLNKSVFEKKNYKKCVYMYFTMKKLIDTENINTFVPNFGTVEFVVFSGNLIEIWQN
jgi:hypothetical protein